MPRVLESLPPLYRSMLGPPLDRDVPEEAKATCARCAMVEGSCPGAVPAVDGRSHLFRADTKCCTYHPRLPNYLVGALLSDPDHAGARGRRRIEERLASRIGVTPGWLHPPRTWSLLYEHAHGAFGRARGLRCPYYAEEDGACTIWKHRDAVCATYYCKYVAGADGRQLWSTVKELLSLVEIQLSRWALLELAPELLDRERWAGRPAAPPVRAEDIDGEPSPAEHRRAWGAWTGREAELYRACFERVRAVTAPELEALLGLDGRLARRAVERAVDAACSTRLPSALRLDPAATVAWLPDGSVALGGYSPLEGVALPGAAYRLLARFDGRPVTETRERLRAEERADLSDDVLLELYRQRVLVEPDP